MAWPGPEVITLAGATVQIVMVGANVALLLRSRRIRRHIDSQIADLSYYRAFKEALDDQADPHIVFTVTRLWLLVAGEALTMGVAIPAAPWQETTNEQSAGTPP